MNQNSKGIVPATNELIVISEILGPDSLYIKISPCHWERFKEQIMKTRPGQTLTFTKRGSRSIQIDIQRGTEDKGYQTKYVGGIYE